MDRNNSTDNKRQAIKLNIAESPKADVKKVQRQFSNLENSLRDTDSPKSPDRVNTDQKQMPTKFLFKQDEVKQTRKNKTKNVIQKAI